MTFTPPAVRPLGRRQFLGAAAVLGTAAVVVGRIPSAWGAASNVVQGQTSALDAARAQMGAAPIVTTGLSDDVMMLAGPGGNVVLLQGAEGSLMIDGFVQPAWPRLKALLDGMRRTPIATLVNSHWHFDHTDNNLNIHETGATIVAHRGTRQRLSERHVVLGMTNLPQPAGALPTRTFLKRDTIRTNGEVLELEHVAPAHTDTDILVRLRRANVLHMGDVFFNGAFPFIDHSTGGNIHGMIAGATRGMALCDARTKVVPGHGPVGTHDSLWEYRDMLVEVRRRVRMAKARGATLEQVVAAKPLNALPSRWGSGFVNADTMVQLVYPSV